MMLPYAPVQLLLFQYDDGIEMPEFLVMTSGNTCLLYTSQVFAEKAGIPIVGEIPRSDEIIRWEDQGKTVIEGDSESEISRRFFDLAEMLLKAEEEE